MPAVGRRTDIATEIESFLDQNEEDLSPNMFRELESVASVVDNMVAVLENKIKDLEEHEEYLINKVTELEEERL